MTYDYEIGDGAHAIDQQASLDHARGYQVVDAAGGSNLVTDGGTANLTVQAASGDINFGGSTVTCSQETVDLSAVVDPDNPRKVTVYRDANGTLDYSAGTAEAAQPTGATRRDAYLPAPPTLSGTDAVVLATVWVGAGASSISNADIRDRRMPAEANFDSVESKSVNTEELNNNEVNLTRLVNDGTYSNIAEAIEQEPGNHPEGIQFIIEPSDYGPISGQYTINGSNYKITAKGLSSRWNPHTQEYPVRIIADSSNTSPLFRFDDADGNNREGIEFAGIKFDGDGGASGAFQFTAATGYSNRELFWRNCAFIGFGDGPFQSINENNLVYACGWYNCSFLDNGGYSFMGWQADFHGCYAAAETTAEPTYQFGRKASVRDLIAFDNVAGADLLGERGGSTIHFKNGESQDGGVCITRMSGTNAGEHSTYLGYISGWDTGVLLDGSSSGQRPWSLMAMPGTTTWYDFQGGNNSHNGAFVVAPYDKVNVATDVQTMMILSPTTGSNVSAADVPQGALMLDNDRGGTGNAALIWGGDSTYNGLPQYFDADGSL